MQLSAIILIYAWVWLLPLSVHDEVPFPKEGSSQNKQYSQSLWANNTISSSKRLIKKKKKGQKWGFNRIGDSLVGQASAAICNWWTCMEL